MHELFETTHDVRVGVLFTQLAYKLEAGLVFASELQTVASLLAVPQLRSKRLSIEIKESDGSWTSQKINFSVT